MHERLENSFLTMDEENALYRFLNHYGIKRELVDQNGAHTAVIKNAVIRGVREGLVPERQRIPRSTNFNTAKDETLIWITADVHYTQTALQKETGKTSGIEHEADEESGGEHEAAEDSGEEHEAAEDNGEEHEAAEDNGEEHEAAEDNGEEHEAEGDNDREQIPETPAKDEGNEYHLPTVFRQKDPEADTTENSEDPGIPETPPTDTGMLGFGTRHLHFAGMKRKSKIPYGQIAVITPVNDGFAITRKSKKALTESFSTGDGWFACNLAQSLAESFSTGDGWFACNLAQSLAESFSTGDGWFACNLAQSLAERLAERLAEKTARSKGAGE